MSTAFWRFVAELEPSRHGSAFLSLRDHVISALKQLERYAGPASPCDPREGLTIDRELNSFQSVVICDPMTEPETRERLAGLFGPLSGPVRLLLSPVPFVAAALDRRLGRLVSFLSHKHGKD